VISWHRFYDPETGRYITADPIGLAGGMNLYRYANADPINWFDPDGLTAAAISGGASGAVGGSSTSLEDSRKIAKAIQEGYGKVCLANQIYRIIIVSAIKSMIYQTGEECGDGDCPSDTDLSDKPNKIADKTGYSPEEIKDAIHKVKKNLPRGGPVRNPDVNVDVNTGEVYPKDGQGGSGDSIGNIFDHLP
jgi:uncharacterized protein RhaS with RHS repeats